MNVLYNYFLEGRILNKYWSWDWEVNRRDQGENLLAPNKLDPRQQNINSENCMRLVVRNEGPEDHTEELERTST